MEISDLPRRYWVGAWIAEVVVASAAWAYVLLENPEWHKAAVLGAYATFWAAIATVGLLPFVEAPGREQWRGCTREVPLQVTLLVAIGLVLVLP